MTLYFNSKNEIEFIDSWREREGLYAKTYLIDDTRNQNEWRVTWPSIIKNAQGFVGMPGIEYHVCASDKCKLDHVEGATYHITKVLQESYRVSNIVEVKLEDPIRSSYAVHEVQDDFYRKLEKEPEKWFVSPAVWPKAGAAQTLGISMKGFPILDVSDWDALHIAYIDKPAYGPHARVHAKCEGLGGDCAVQMNAAVRDSHPMMVMHGGNMTYYDPPEDLDQMIQKAATNEEAMKILNSKVSTGYDMTPCDLNMKLDILSAKMQVLNLERAMNGQSYMASSPTPGEEKTKDKPDVDERGQKCHWVKSKGRTFQICDDVKQPKTQSPKSERKEEERK